MSAISRLNASIFVLFFLISERSSLQYHTWRRSPLKNFRDRASLSLQFYPLWTKRLVCIGSSRHFCLLQFLLLRAHFLGKKKLSASRTRVGTYVHTHVELLFDPDKRGSDKRGCMVPCKRGCITCPSGPCIPDVRITTFTVKADCKDQKCC